MVTAEAKINNAATTVTALPSLIVGSLKQLLEDLVARAVAKMSSDLADGTSSLSAISTASNIVRDVVG